MEDKDWYQFAGEVQKSLGRIEATQQSHYLYLEAVSKNGKELKKTLEDHIADDSNKLNDLKQCVDRVAVGISNESNDLKQTAKALSDHIVDDEAHGEKERGRAWDLIGKIGAGIVAAAAAIYGAYKAGRQ